MRKPIRVSDAIPKMPVSFEQTVERTLNSVCKEQKSSVRTKERTAENRWVPTGESVRTTKKQPKIRQLLAYGAVAVLLVAVVGIGALVIKNGLSGKQTELSQGMTDQTELPRAIRYHGMVYVITDHEAAGEPDKSAILKTTENPVPSVQWPTEEGQTNFGETSYAMTIDGLVVLYDNEWCMFEPLLPDTNKGVFEAAYAQVLLEQYEFDRIYAARRAKMETMSEEEAQDYDTIMEGEENFLHQRFVRLQRLNEVTASVEQEVDRMRLSEIAYLDGRLYFAFAASKVWAFDAEPEIRINGTQYHAIDDSGFFALKETETEHYAFYEIEPGTLSGTVQITVKNVKNNDHAFCFKYDADNGIVVPAQDDATLQSDVSYCFLVDGEPVYPYEGFVWESKPELEADGAGVRLEDEEVRSRIPATNYSAGMPFAVLTADGWQMDEIIVFDAAYERIVNVAGRGIPKDERNNYVVTDLLKTLSPGTYYVSAIVSYRTENYSKGNEIAICLHVGTGAGEPSTTDAPILQPEPSLLPTPFPSQSSSDPSSTQPPKDADEPQTYVTWSAALTELLRTEHPDTVLDISIIAITYNEEDDLGFLYQGKSLTEYREEPALAAYREAYDLWYYTVYPAVDEQNRGTPGWEKHDPGALFDAYWRERHTDAEIRAYEQAAEAYGEAKNALRNWRDSAAGKDAVRAFLQQECDRLNACGFRLQVVRVEDTQSYRLDGTATVGQLRAFPARDVTHFYWITLYNDDSPIDE